MLQNLNIGAFFNDSDRRRGIIGTLVFHLILLLIFVFSGLTYTYPPPEQGIRVNFGDSPVGGGRKVATAPQKQTTPQPTPQKTAPAQPVPKTNDQVLTQDESPVSVPADSEPQTAQPAQEAPPVERTLDDQLASALNTFKDAEDGDPGQGPGKEPGDIGRKDGDPNAKSPVGGSGGNGTSYSLHGRKLLSVPRIHDNTQEEGIVVVEIIVDRNGNVIKATPGAKGTTAASQVLHEKARKAALKTKFNSTLYSPEIQRGTMTFVFVLQ